MSFDYSHLYRYLTDAEWKVGGGATIEAVFRRNGPLAPSDEHLRDGLEVTVIFNDGTRVTYFVNRDVLNKADTKQLLDGIVEASRLFYKAATIPSALDLQP